MRPRGPDAPSVAALLVDRSLVVFLLTLLYIFIVSLFVFVQSIPCRDCAPKYLTNIYLLISLLGAILWMIRLRAYRLSFTHPHGFVPALCCGGLVAWSIGQLIWMHYTLVRGDPKPFPSAADAAFIIGHLFFSTAIIALYRLAGTIPLRELASYGPPFLAALIATNWFVTNPAPDISMAEFFISAAFYAVDFFNCISLAGLIVGPTSEKLTAKVPLMRAFLMLLLAGLFLCASADLAFGLTISLPEDHPLAYYNGNWTELTYATAFYLVAMGVHLAPIGQRTEVGWFGQGSLWRTCRDSQAPDRSAPS
jgi:hypothetical protein